MAKTPFLETPVAIRGLGAAFVALMVFFVWLTFAFFNKTFVSQVPVTLTTTNSGLSLPSNADVKLRGMIVGEVRSIQPNGEGIKIKIAMKPSAIKLIPRDVTAQIIPKTLFGEKYIDLLPPAHPDGQSLKAGDNITKAVVPIELEALLNDLYPLLEAVQPAELSSTLSAVSEALSGRGTQLGSTLKTANNYLEQINPDVGKLIDDAVKLGKVSDVYAAALPDLGRVLKNAVVTGDTIVAKRAQLAAFFDEGTKLSDTTTAFLKQNGDNIITVAHQGRPVIEMLSDYSKVFPCVLKSVSDITPKLNSAFRNNKLHIRISLIALQDQPTGYAADENATIPTKSVIDAEPLADPSCHSLPNSPYSHDAGHRRPKFPFEVFQKFGLKTTHSGKFRTPVASTDDPSTLLSGASIDGVDSVAQRDGLNTLLGASLGMTSSKVPDIASLLVSPIFRGSEVTVSEAR